MYKVNVYLTPRQLDALKKKSEELGIRTDLLLPWASLQTNRYRDDPRLRHSQRMP